MIGLAQAKESHRTRRALNRCMRYLAERLRDHKHVLLVHRAIQAMKALVPPRSPRSRFLSQGCSARNDCKPEADSTLYPYYSTCLL